MNDNTKPFGASKMPARMALALMALGGALTLAPDASASPYVTGFNAAARVLPYAQQWVKQPQMPMTVLGVANFARNQVAPRDSHFAQAQFRTRTTTPQYTTRRR